MRTFNNSDVGYPDPEWLDDNVENQKLQTDGKEERTVHEDRNVRIKK